MTNIIDGNAQLVVEIINLYASKAQLDTLECLIESKLMNNMSPIRITSISNTKTGTRYTISFRVFEPRRCSFEQVEEWLSEAKLDRYNLEITSVPAEK